MQIRFASLRRINYKNQYVQCFEQSLYAWIYLTTQVHILNQHHFTICQRQGFEDGITQITRTSDGDMQLIWNFPIEVVYRSTNAFGWPQVALSVYSVDSIGR